MSLLNVYSTRLVRTLQAPMRSTQRWCHGKHSTKESNPWFQRITVRIVAGGIFFWCSSMFMVLSYADWMRYRRTVNTFYGNFGREVAFNVDRNDEEETIKNKIKDSRSMNLFYGKCSVGKSHLVSNACSNIDDEPVFYLEIVNSKRFVIEFADKLKYFHNEDVTLSNYLRWINPPFAMGRKEKNETTLDDIIIHLRECQKWLQRVQSYPWNKALGRYQGKLNIVLDSFDRLISLDPSTSPQIVAESNEMAQNLIQTGKQWNDANGIRLNFVFSQGSLHSFSSIAGTGAAKRMTVHEIKEIEEAKAIDYLQNDYHQKYDKILSQKEAKKLYVECGGLFNDMKEMINVGGDIAAFKSSKYGDFSSDFVELGLFISPNKKKLSETDLKAWNILKIVESEKEIHFDEALNITDSNNELLNALTDKKGPLYLTIGRYPKYKFTSTPMANYVKEVIAECASLLNTAN